MLGITKDVDMVFTRKHEICWMHVLVLDTNLIPQFVDVVIGDYLYTLQFKVEENGEEEKPQPIDMDCFQEDDKQFEDMQEGQDSFDHTNNPQGKGGNAANGVLGTNSTVNGAHGVKKQLFNTVVPDPISVPNQKKHKRTDRRERGYFVV
jgi:hypothetical protein